MPRSELGDFSHILLKLCRQLFRQKLNIVVDENNRQASSREGFRRNESSLRNLNSLSLLPRLQCSLFVCSKQIYIYTLPAISLQFLSMKLNLLCSNSLIKSETWKRTRNGCFLQLRARSNKGACLLISRRIINCKHFPDIRQLCSSM